MGINSLAKELAIMNIDTHVIRRGNFYFVELHREVVHTKEDKTITWGMGRTIQEALLDVVDLNNSSINELANINKTICHAIPDYYHFSNENDEEE